MARANVPDDVAIESKVVSRAIRSAQSQVEARNAEIRKNVLKYDDVLNRQREAIYSDRRHILEGDDLHERVQNFLEDVIDEVIDEHTGRGHTDELGLRRALDRAQDALPGRRHDRRGRRRGRREGPDHRELHTREILSDAKHRVPATARSTLGAPGDARARASRRAAR